MEHAVEAIAWADRGPYDDAALANLPRQALSMLGALDDDKLDEVAGESPNRGRFESILIGWVLALDAKVRFLAAVRDWPQDN